MYFVDGTMIDRAPIVDTKDWVAEYIDQATYNELIQQGVSIFTVMDAVMRFTDADYARSAKKLYYQAKRGENLADYLRNHSVASIVDGMLRIKASNLVSRPNSTVKMFDYSETDGFIIVCIPAMFRPSANTMVEGMYCLPIDEDGYCGRAVTFQTPLKFGKYPCAGGRLFIQKYGATNLNPEEVYLHVVDARTGEDEFLEVIL